MPKDETTKTQDTSSDKAGQSSGSKGGTTSKEKGKLYTDAEILKIKSDSAAEAGRLRKAAETERDSLKKDLESTTGRLDDLERQINESRLAEVRNDPNALRAYQTEQSSNRRLRDVEARERDIARREEQHKADREALSKDKSFVNLAYVAAKHGLDTEDLESFGIDDPEVLEKVAERIAAGKGTTQTKEGGEPFNPDSGDTSGAGELTEKQMLDKRYPTTATK